MTHNYKFESVADLVAAKRVPFACEHNAQLSYQRDIAQGEYYWVCPDRRVASHDDVSSYLLAQTFPQGVQRVESLAPRIQAPTPLSRRRKPVRSDAGDELDLSRVWQGDLANAWRTMRRQQTVGPARVLIAIDVAASGATDSQLLAFRGAAAFKLASLLVETGYTVGILAYTNVYLTDNRKTPYTAEVSLLPAGAELDLHKLCNLVASALLFRGVLMDHMCRVSENSIDSGIADLTDEKPVIDSTGFDHVAFMTSANGVAAASKWVADQITTLQGDRT